jgi:hypothetical protein
MVQSHSKVRDLLNASQIVFHAWHSMTLHCIRLVGHVTLNFNNNMSSVDVSLDVRKAFDTTWHPDLLFKLHN